MARKKKKETKKTVWQVFKNYDDTYDVWKYEVVGAKRTLLETRIKVKTLPKGVEYKD